MDSGFDKNQTISDYVAMLEALLPATIGAQCVDSNGSCFFDQVGGDEIEFSQEYADALQAVLTDPDRAAEIGRIELDAALAILFPLVGEQDKLLGVITLLLESGSDLTWQDAFDRANPAVRSLERELALRYRLVTSYRKLNVRSAEENLLHQVEKLVHQRRSCEETLSHILLLCRKFLQVSGAALLIPDKHVRLFEGEGLSPVEARLLLSDLSDSTGFKPHIQAVGGHDEATLEDARFNAEKDLLALPVHHHHQEPVGILALSGWEKCNFSSRRRRRIGRYLVAHIEDVIARDYDALTGLMSWPLFEEKLLEVCAGVEKEAGLDDFVLYCDIDQFHVVNDTFGPDAADELLAEFARLLRDRIGKQMVTRISGDTFAALLPQTDLDTACAQAEEIGKQFAKLESVRGNQTLRPSVSVGVAPITGLPATASAAMAPAQVACRAAKERGRGRVECCQKDDESIIQRLDDIQLVGHIRNAIENARLLVAAQPIVGLKEGNNARYYEVLTRLISPTGELVMPAEFFSAAERYQLMEELDRLVITETLGILEDRIKGLDSIPFRIAINLSGQSLGSEQFLPFVEEKIAASSVPADVLCFEITETVAVANLQRAQTFMHALKKLGCHFSLDDFGTGLSSFAYLKMFPVDTLKIDGNFVQDITTNVVSQSVVAAISEVARVMNLETVAEYVEDEDAYNLVRDLGVTFAQGFLLGQPEPLAETLDSLISSLEAEQISA